MATNKSIQYINYFLLKTVIIDDIAVSIYTCYGNIEQKYVIEWTIPKVACFDRDTTALVTEYCTCLIQISQDNKTDYNILNIYYKGRNHKAESFTRPYRYFLNNVVWHIIH